MMNKKTWIGIIVGIGIGLLAITAILLLLFLPSSQNAFPYENTPYQVVVNGNVRTDVTVINGERYFSWQLVRDAIDPYLWWDANGETITITNGSGVWDYTEQDGVLLQNGTAYVSEGFLKKAYGVAPTYIAENDLSFWLEDTFYMGVATSLKQTLCIRQEPSLKSPRVQVISKCKGEQVAYILDATNYGWYRVVSFTGEVGFVPCEQVSYSKNELFDREKKGVNTETPGANFGAPKFLEDFSNEKINMVWEAVYSRNPDTEAIGDMEGLDVIAPTWFTLEDAQGTISCLASKEYVDWAHARGYAVWGTVQSYFSDPEVTSAMLHDMVVRRQFIEQLISYANEYDLDGINVDFENMKEADKWLFTQFVRELMVACRKNNLVLSVCCTALSTSSYWSLCYDRPSLAASVDYLCVMLYDQHGAGSQVAGSVSQLSWMKQSLNSLLKQIPAEKIIMGMPFYTRLWKSEPQEDGTVKMTSSALYMEDAAAWVAQREITPVWDEESGQFYVSYVEGDITYEMWLEDRTSIEKRVALVSQYDLAGCAAWRRGFETADIWPAIAEGLLKQYNT